MVTLAFKVFEFVLKVYRLHPIADKKKAAQETGRRFRALFTAKFSSAWGTGHLSLGMRMASEFLASRGQPPVTALGLSVRFLTTKPSAFATARCR